MERNDASYFLSPDLSSEKRTLAAKEADGERRRRDEGGVNGVGPGPGYELEPCFADAHRCRAATTVKERGQRSSLLQALRPRVPWLRRVVRSHLHLQSQLLMTDA